MSKELDNLINKGAEITAKREVKVVPSKKRAASDLANNLLKDVETSLENQALIKGKRYPMKTVVAAYENFEEAAGGRESLIETL